MIFVPLAHSTDGEQFVCSTKSIPQDRTLFAYIYANYFNLSLLGTFASDNNQFPKKRSISICYCLNQGECGFLYDEKDCFEESISPTDCGVELECREPGYEGNASLNFNTKRKKY